MTHACRAIDTHAHWYPEEWLRLFAKDGAAEGASLERSGTRYTIRTNRIVNAFAEELGWTIFLHPIDTLARERTSRYYLKNLLGNPYDTGVAAASLVFGGVLDEFPKLEVNLPHAGGTFPWLIGRLDHGTRVRPELRHMKRLPSEYLRRFTYDTIGHNDQINLNLIR